MSKLNSKGDAISPAIMWLLTLVIALILVIWYFSSLSRIQTYAGKAEFDLDQLSDSLSDACIAKSYKKIYNPRSETGFLIIEGENLCINTSILLCRLVVCDTGLNKSLDLTMIKEILILRFPTGEFDILENE